MKAFDQKTSNSNILFYSGRARPTGKGDFGLNDGGAFLHQKIKESGNTLERFAQTCGVSKSTLYRVLRGTQKLTPPLASRISDVLRLTHYERERLYRCFSLPFDTPPLSAFDMDRMFRQILGWFTNQDNLGQMPTEEDIVFFDDISSAKAVHSPESFAKHIASTLSPNCKHISIYIYNCCHERPMFSTFRFLDELLNITENIQLSVDHILNFHEHQSGEQINFIRKFYPLFQSPACRYQFYYRQSYYENASWLPSIMENAIVFSYQAVYPDQQAYPRYVLLLPDSINFSEGFSSREPFFHQHMISKFLQIRENYTPGIQSSISIENVPSGYDELYDSFVFKRDFIYNHIHPAVYASYYARLKDNTELWEQFYRLLEIKRVGRTEEELIASLSSQFLRTFDAHRTRRCITILTADGLTEFAMTGRNFELPAFFPSLTSDEVCIQLDFFLSLLRGEDPLWKVFILPSSAVPNDSHWAFHGWKDVGVSISCPYADAMRESVDCLFLSPSFGSLFFAMCDSCEEYGLALPNKEAIHLVEDLLKKLR